MNDDNPPVPAGAVSQADLTGRLRALWTWAGQPSEAALRSLIRMRRTASGFVVEGVPSGTMERLLAGDESAWESVEPFVASCLRVGSQSRERIDQDLAAWREAWQRIVPPRPAGSFADPVPAGTVRRLLSRVRSLAGTSPSGTPAGDPYLDPRTRRTTGRPPSMPALRPALVAATAVAVLFTAGAWAIVDSADPRVGPHPVPSVSRSGVPVSASPTSSPSPRPSAK
ncbi:hypothetical protein [Rugosimonospora africana]|uniref:Uncharacterized protein n=1 Tax=Rugosimonospora africana TaxID=556532 RepID=A0A8J3QZV9_9ACTN|nr:hypothetical protein [Rugosimonospora africana]GIH17661.1 hypothetical protein Raf01_58330 [Rugosimonospora africana]